MSRIAIHERPAPTGCRALARILALAALLGSALPAAAQSPPPDADWLTFRTEHFRVTYQPGLEPIAERAGAVAEQVYGILAEELNEPPGGTIDLLVTDHVDFSNGLASPFPSQRITVYAHPPTGMPQLAFTRNWIEMVVAHELVHIFHLDETGAFGHVVRTIFGHVPMIWPLFPVAGSPTWNVEGLATYWESRLTGAGRIPGSFHEMVARTAALEHGIPDLDDVSAPHPAWPGGQRSYGYGGRLMDYIAEVYGPDSHHAIIEATGASFLPTFLMFDHVARDAVGRSFDSLFRVWRARATDQAHAVAEELAEAGLTETEPVAGEGPHAADPRLSPDGARLSFAAHDFRSNPATRVVELATGQVRTLGDRNQFGTLLGPAAWTPDGEAMILAQLELQGPYRAYSDLWRIDLDGDQRRLTHGERLAQPDVAPDGRRVAAIRSDSGALDLVIHDLETGETRLLANSAPGDAYDSPRWSPDGTRIAAGRYVDGRVDLVVVDPGTGAVTTITRDDALDLAPAWSPDGDWVLWWSDRTGIPNIMAASVGAGTPRSYQVTRVATGAFDPAVSPDGRTLYLSVYHHDGWRIERMPFDPGSWEPAPEPTLTYREGLLRPTDQAVATLARTPASPYSPWPTVRPHFWLPEWVTMGDAAERLRFPGATTWGYDLVGRHEWTVSAGVDVLTGRFRGQARWLYRGLGNPDLQATVARNWAYNSTVPVAGHGDEAIFQRNDRFRLETILRRARWRSAGFLRVSGEVERASLEGFELSDEVLRAALQNWPEPRTLLGLSLGPGFSTARVHPLSISAEGVSGSVGIGRWWNADAGARAYDEASGVLNGYFGFPLWGFANHVLAGHLAGVYRDGPLSATRGIGGVPGGGLPTQSSYLPDTFDTGTFLAVRGFEPGARRGTRALAFNGEWRFPLHLSDAPPGRMFGFSLTSISGALFGDAGYAWCAEDEARGQVLGCDPAAEDVLASVGAELSVRLGVLHNLSTVVRFGVAEPVAPEVAREPEFYVSFGRSF